MRLNNFVFVTTTTTTTIIKITTAVSFLSGISIYIYYNMYILLVNNIKCLADREHKIIIVVVAAAAVVRIILDFDKTSKRLADRRGERALLPDTNPGR